MKTKWIWWESHWTDDNNGWSVSGINFRLNLFNCCVSIYVQHQAHQCTSRSHFQELICQKVELLLVSTSRRILFASLSSVQLLSGISCLGNKADAWNGACASTSYFTWNSTRPVSLCVDRAEYQAKMASIDFRTLWSNTHSLNFTTKYQSTTSVLNLAGAKVYIVRIKLPKSTVFSIRSEREREWRKGQLYLLISLSLQPCAQNRTSMHLPHWQHLSLPLSFASLTYSLCQHKKNKQKSTNALLTTVFGILPCPRSDYFRSGKEEAWWQGWWEKENKFFVSRHRKISPTEQIEMKLWREKSAKGGKRERERECAVCPDKSLTRKLPNVVAWSNFFHNETNTQMDHNLIGLIWHYSHQNWHHEARTTLSSFAYA